jgi:hypothetical protein
MLKNPITVKEITKKKKKAKTEKRSVSPRGRIREERTSSPRLRSVKEGRSRSPRFRSGSLSPRYRDDISILPRNHGATRNDRLESPVNRKREDRFGSPRKDHRNDRQYQRRDDRSLSPRKNSRQETRNQRVDLPKQDIEEKLAEMKRNATLFKKQRAQRIESEIKEKPESDYRQSNNFLSIMHKESLNSRNVK